MSESKIIVITGATRGLGRALVDYFTPQGHRIAGCGRSDEQVQTLQSQYPEPHFFRAVDVRDDHAVSEWADEVITRLGNPDLLINNAGVINQPAALWQIPAEEFDQVIDINIKGVVNVIRAFVPHMIERQRGVIVNLSSGWGRSTAPEVAPYCATKYAIEGLTLALAEELPKGMAAIPLNPGIIDTDMLRDVWGDGAGQFPNAEKWVKAAGPFLLNLSTRDNGRSLTVS